MNSCRLLDWTAENNLVCFTSGNAAFFMGQTHSVLDLMFAKGEIISSWRTLDTPCNSGHVPIVFDIAVSPRSPNHIVHTLLNYQVIQQKLRLSVSSLPKDPTKTRALEVTPVLKNSLENSQVVSSTKKRQN